MLWVFIWIPKTYVVMESWRKSLSNCHQTNTLSVSLAWMILLCFIVLFVSKWAPSQLNQQNDLCAQRRLRSAWASAQSDQCLHWPHEETLGPQLPIERTAKTDQTWRMPRLIRVGWAHRSFCWFCHEAAQMFSTHEESYPDERESPVSFLNIIAKEH